MKRKGLTVACYPEVMHDFGVALSPEATSVSYRDVPAPVATVFGRLHGALLPDLLYLADRLAVDLPPPLPHRVDPLQWSGRRRPPRSLPPLLQHGRLVLGQVVAVAGPS